MLFVNKILICSNLITKSQWLLKWQFYLALLCLTVIPSSSVWSLHLIVFSTRNFVRFLKTQVFKYSIALIIICPVMCLVCLYNMLVCLCLCVCLSIYICIYLFVYLLVNQSINQSLSINVCTFPPHPAVLQSRHLIHLHMFQDQKVCIRIFPVT